MQHLKASHIEVLLRMRDPATRSISRKPRSNTPMSAMTRTWSTNRKGVSMMIVVNVFPNLY